MYTTNLFVLATLALFAGCGNEDTDTVDTGETETDTDTDADADSDSDSDADADTGAEGSIRVVVETSVDTAVDGKSVACTWATDTECVIDGVSRGEHTVAISKLGYLFTESTEKTVSVTSSGEVTADFASIFAEGKWGADFGGCWIDDDGTEHEVDVYEDNQFVYIDVSRASGCNDSLMTGLDFNYAVDEDGNWCSGYGSEDMNELFIDHGSSVSTYYHHLTRVDC